MLFEQQYENGDACQFCQCAKNPGESASDRATLMVASFGTFHPLKGLSVSICQGSGCPPSPGPDASDVLLTARENAPATAEATSRSMTIFKMFSWNIPFHLNELL